jgi:hypothetical protein
VFIFMLLCVNEFANIAGKKVLVAWRNQSWVSAGMWCSSQPQEKLGTVLLFCLGHTTYFPLFSSTVLGSWKCRYPKSGWLIFKAEIYIK